MKRMMTSLSAIFVVVALCFSTVSFASARTEANQVLDTSASVLQQFPDSTVPNALLKQAYGIAIIPSVITAGFIAGGRYGKGVLLVRTADGGWSNPVFIRLYGGSFGFQAGISSTDLLLVFKTRRSVEHLSNGSVLLGADATATAGPVGRHAGAATNWRFDAEVYSYSRSRGLFAGVALNGTRLGIDDDLDWGYYQDPDLDAHRILRRSNRSALSPSGKRLLRVLDQEMPAYTGHERRSGGGDGTTDQTQSSNTRDTTDTAADNQKPSTSQNAQESSVTVKRLDVQNQAAESDGKDTAAAQPSDNGDYGSNSYGNTN